MKRSCRSIFILATIVLLVPLHVRAQPRKKSQSTQKPQSTLTNVQFASGNSSLGIPLEIDNKIILMSVRVNRSEPLRFIFDTGASMTVISSKRAAELGLKTQGRLQVGATGGNVEVSLVEGVEILVQGAKLSNQTIAVHPLPSPPGFEFDGIIGSNFISRFVVEIDYLKRIMNLHNPRSYRYTGTGASIPLDFAESTTPLANVEFFLDRRTPIAARLEVDTGGDNAFILNSPFVKKHNLVEAMQSGSQETRRGAGGEQKVIAAQAKAVRFGPFTLSNPPVALSLDTEGAGASEENDGILGGEILRRFKLILDYSRKRMILERNKSFNDPYEVEGG